MGSMSEAVLRIFDIINGVITAAAFVFLVLTISRKPRFSDRKTAVAIGTAIYQAGILLELIVFQKLDYNIHIGASNVAGLIILSAIIFTVSKDTIGRNLITLLLYCIPHYIVIVSVRFFLKLYTGSFSGITQSDYLVSLLKTFTVNFSISFCVCIILLINRRNIRGVIIPMVMMICFPLLGFTNLIFALIIAPDKVGLINCAGAALQLYITAAIATLLSVFVRRNNELIAEKKEQMEIQSLREIDMQYYEGVQRDIKYVRKFRHDITNYVEQIEYLLDHPEEHSDELIREMVSNLKIRTSKISAHHYCEDPISNMVLTLKNDKCKNNGIPFTVKANLPESLETDPLDRSSILSNILDNAINEAVRSKEAGMDPFVNCNIGIVGDYAVLRVENSTLIEDEINDISELMKLNRENKDSDLHGLGLVIIQEKVDKNDGTLMLNIKDHKCEIIATVKIGDTGEITNVQSSGI